MLDRSFWVEARWGSRVETPAAIAERFLRTIDGLRAINPILDDWSWGDYYELPQTERTAPGSRVGLNGSAGARPTGGLGVTAFTNDINFEVGPKPDPSLVSYPLWRAVLLLAETWEASWAEASPGDINAAWSSGGGYFKCAWMSYVSPHFAPLVAPPAGVVAERRPNGGLFMAATADTFRTADPEHLAAARAIEVALAPMNRLAYPVDDPYR